jgi:K+-sensing histidine kinase KdpD
MGVSVEVHSYDGLELEQCSSDLLVVRSQTPALKTMLSERTVSSVLVCPQTWSPSSRFLLLDDGQADSDAYLSRALELCRQLRIIPVLLTWARSERAALVRQERIRNLLGVSGPFAVFDTIVGGDLRAAVAGVARWRKCQTVVACHSLAPRWPRWLRSSAAEQIMDLADSLAVLALPAAAVKEASALPARGLPAAAASALPAALLDWLRPMTWGRSPAVRHS